MKKRWIAMVMSGLLCVSMLSGCGGSDSDGNGNAEGEAAMADAGAEDDLIHVAFLTASLSDENWQTWTQAAVDNAADYGMKVTVTDCAGNSATQVQQIESSIEAGYDVIVVGPADTNALSDAAKKANEAGIPVVTVDGYFDNCSVVVGANEYEDGYTLGKNAAEWLNKNQPEKKSLNVCTLSFDFIQVCIDRKNGYLDGLKENCDAEINIVADVSPKTAAEATEMSESVLQADNVDVAMAVAGDFLYGYTLACDSLGITDTVGFTMDATPSAMRLLKDDKYLKGIATWGTSEEKGINTLKGCQMALEADLENLTEDDVHYLYYDLLYIDENNVDSEITRFGWDKE